MSRSRWRERTTWVLAGCGVLLASGGQRATAAPTDPGKPPAPAAELAAPEPVKPGRRDKLKPYHELVIGDLRADPIRRKLLQAFAAKKDLSPETTRTMEQLQKALTIQGNEENIRIVKDSWRCNDRGCLVDVEYREPMFYAHHARLTSLPESDFYKFTSGAGRTGLLTRGKRQYVASWFLQNPQPKAENKP
jgi:hypothetical protein